MKKTSLKLRHAIYAGLLTRRVSVGLIGAGGSGSQMLTRLARLDHAIRALGHPGGLDVTVWDDDTVSESNVGRQMFYPADVGMPKASVLVHRINMAFGLTWRARTERFTAERRYQLPADVLITCVDSAAARREIHSVTRAGAPTYWLDMGNSAKSGQVFLTQPAIRPIDLTIPRSVASTPTEFSLALEEGARRGQVRDEADLLRLPDLAQLLPEIFDESIPEDDAPSCSLAEALERQDLAVNDAVTTWAFHLLWTLFRTGGLDVCGYWISLESGMVAPVAIPGSDCEKRGQNRKAGSYG